MRKSIVVIFIYLNIKNNKINKDNFEKNHKKKIIWGKIIAINDVLKKKKNYKAKFSISSV
jgi:predicted secreted protein